MPQATSEKPSTLTKKDLDVLYALSLKGYRFPTCRHLSMLHFASKDACQEMVAQLSQAGLVSRLFIPTANGEDQQVIYTLARHGAHKLARLRGMSAQGLANARKPSYLFLEHGLTVSESMCSLEAAVKGSSVRLLSWRSERQLKSSRGRALRVPHPFELGERIPVVPDGLFSLLIDGREEHFFLEGDRGTMSLFAMRKKLLGYIQLYRKGLHRTFFRVPHFRVLLVTSTAYRRNRLRDTLREIGYCPNMFWFALWRDVSPARVMD